MEYLKNQKEKESSPIDGTIQTNESAIMGNALVQAPSVKDEEKVGRNDLCPCGSGKKFKKCHGA